MISHIVRGLCVVAALGFFAMHAAAQQKIGWVSTEAIMQKLPEAQDAQKQLDALVADWQNELKKMQDGWQQKFNDYDKKKLLMSDTRRAEAERELMDLEKKISDYRNQKFGPNGELFQKQNEIMKPVQDKVFNAIQKVAADDGYDYILDKSGDALLLFSNDKYDLTDKVLAALKAPPSK